MGRIRPVLALAFAIASHAGAEGFGKGAIELSGMGEYAYRDDKAPGPNTITRSVTLTSSLSFYPGRWAFLGPVLEYTRIRTESEDPQAFNTLVTVSDLGMQAAFLANYSDKPLLPLPYLGGAVGLSGRSAGLSLSGPAIPR